MPTRKPKRTNWKRRFSDCAVEYAREVNAHQDTNVALEKSKKGLHYWKAWAEDAEDKLKAAIERAESAERHNAELLKEREAVVKCNYCDRHFDRFADAHIHCCNSPSCVYKYYSKYWLAKRPSWLRRNWVELAVMATVLGAIGFIVWRAWR